RPPVVAEVNQLRPDTRAPVDDLHADSLPLADRQALRLKAEIPSHAVGTHRKRQSQPSTQRRELRRRKPRVDFELPDPWTPIQHRILAQILSEARIAFSEKNNARGRRPIDFVAVGNVSDRIVTGKRRCDDFFAGLEAQSISGPVVRVNARQAGGLELLAEK